MGSSHTIWMDQLNFNMCKRKFVPRIWIIFRFRQCGRQQSYHHHSNLARIFENQTRFRSSMPFWISTIVHRKCVFTFNYRWSSSLVYASIEWVFRFHVLMYRNFKIIICIMRSFCAKPCAIRWMSLQTNKKSPLSWHLKFSVVAFGGNVNSSISVRFAEKHTMTLENFHRTGQTIYKRFFTFLPNWNTY